MSADECLWQSTRNLLNAQENLNKLFEAFDRLTIREAGLVVEFNSQDKSARDWVEPSWNCYYDVRGNRKANASAIGALTIAIQLTCDHGEGPEWSFGKRAKVVVGYSAKQEDWWEFGTTVPNAAGYLDEVCTPNETHWSGSYGGRDAWVFAVPLDMLTSTDAVDKYIKEPVHRILRGEAPTNVLGKEGVREGLCIPPQG